MHVAPRAGHDAAQVVDSAAHLLFEPHQTPCVPSKQSDAEGLFISELLADPPSTDAGDTNGDGRRDAAEDEFVEIVNMGSKSICLSGWALRDVKKPERHVFPIGTIIEPGHAVVVFGGGVPPANIGGAKTLTAAFSGRLSLTNDGDVVTLLDPENKAVSRVSWGDCGGAPCATDHYDGTLDISGSITRSATWRKHELIDGKRFSPGRHWNVEISKTSAPCIGGKSGSGFVNSNFSLLAGERNAAVLLADVAQGACILCASGTPACI